MKINGIKKKTTNYNHLIFGTEAKDIHWRKDSLFNR
jgi:hypothetical protein